jgi:hypothetical protein
MKRIGFVLAIMIAIPLVLLWAQQDSTPAGQLASMTWLEGAWSGTFAGGPFWARYSSPEGGNILSMNKVITDKPGPGYVEFERFSYDDTSVFLVPYPDGKPHSLKFRLVETTFDSTKKTATFRNAANDWPTNLTYARVSADSLIITLSGPGEEGVGEQVLEARLGMVKGE